MKNYSIIQLTAILIVIFSFMILSCDKDDNNDVNEPLVFESLTASTDTIYPGGTTEITATASGDGITYTWSATAGDILGSGNKITYVSPPCVVGENEISCTVKDKGNNQLSKSVTIYVF